MENFNWGDSPEEFNKLIHKEIFEDKMYEKVFKVKEGDVVFDIGASTGAFAYSILGANPKHVFCFEPSYKEFMTLVLNTRQASVTCVNKAISGIVGEFKSEYIFDNDQDKIYSTTFMQVIKDYNINKIDFLKMDCEGGEYDICNAENLLWIKQNVSQIIGEWHLSTPELKNNFRIFRENYLTASNYKIYSLDNFDITMGVWSDEFIDYYTEVIIHIDNKKAGG